MILSCLRGAGRGQEGLCLGFAIPAPPPSSRRATCRALGGALHFSKHARPTQAGRQKSLQCSAGRLTHIPTFTAAHRCSLPLPPQQPEPRAAAPRRCESGAGSAQDKRTAAVI